MAFGRLLEELQDPHAHLNQNLATSPRLVPCDTDLWAESRDGGAVMTRVRNGSRADRAGIPLGAVVVAINGFPTQKIGPARLARAYAGGSRLGAPGGARGSAPYTPSSRAGTAGRIWTAEAADSASPVDASETRPGIGHIRPERRQQQRGAGHQHPRAVRGAGTAVPHARPAPKESRHGCLPELTRTRSHAWAIRPCAAGGRAREPLDRTHERSAGHRVQLQRRGHRRRGRNRRSRRGDDPDHAPEHGHHHRSSSRAPAPGERHAPGGVPFAWTLPGPRPAMTLPSRGGEDPGGPMSGVCR